MRKIALFTLSLIFGARELLSGEDMHGFRTVSISTGGGHNYTGFPVGFGWENDDTLPSESLSRLWHHICAEKMKSFFAAS